MTQAEIELRLERVEAQAEASRLTIENILKAIEGLMEIIGNLKKSRSK